MKFDTIIIFGVILDNNGRISNILRSRLDVGINLYKGGTASKMIMVGGLSNVKAKITEAEAMKKYTLKKGVNKNDILKEEKSTDTIGNIFFVKQNILKPKRWKKLIVVTSDFHMERVKYLLKKILGNGYKIRFVKSKAFSIPILIYRWLGYEKDFISLTKAFFKNIRNGNDKKIKEIIDKIHPLYSDKNLMKLSDEELSRKFNLDIKIIKKVRKIIEKRIRSTKVD